MDSSPQAVSTARQATAWFVRAAMWRVATRHFPERIFAQCDVTAEAIAQAFLDGNDAALSFLLPLAGDCEAAAVKASAGALARCSKIQFLAEVTAVLMDELAAADGNDRRVQALQPAVDDHARKTAICARLKKRAKPERPQRWSRERASAKALNLDCSFRNHIRKLGIPRRARGCSGRPPARRSRSAQSRAPGDDSGGDGDVGPHRLEPFLAGLLVRCAAERGCSLEVYAEGVKAACASEPELLRSFSAGLATAEGRLAR